jgi:hypothetical protein
MHNAFRRQPRQRPCHIASSLALYSKGTYHMDDLRLEAPAQARARTPCGSYRSINPVQLFSPVYDDSGLALILLGILSALLAAECRVKPAHEGQGVNAKGKSPSHRRLHEERGAQAMRWLSGW